jgi:hypothetical protein
MLSKLTELLKGGVDPKWIVVLAWLVGVQKGIGQGAISLTNMVPESWIPHVIAWNNGLAWLGVGLMGLLAALSSNSPGPLIGIPNIALPSIDATKTVVKIILVAFALSFLVAGGSAQAAQLKAPQVTGDFAADAKANAAALLPSSGGNSAPAADTAPAFCDILRLLPGCKPMDPADLWKKIAAPAIKADLTYSKALADNAATEGSKLRSTCYGAILTANAQANGDNLKNKDGTPMAMPDPHVIATIEQGAELIDNLQPTAPVISGCAAAANAAKVSAIQFVTGIVALVGAKVATAGVLP